MCVTRALPRVVDRQIGDLGVSRLLGRDSNLQSRVGTPLYLAPELIRQEPYSYKASASCTRAVVPPNHLTRTAGPQVDIWSLGCVMYTLAALQAPFRGENLLALAQVILHKKPKPLPHFYTKSLSTVIASMLEKVANKRPTITQVRTSAVTAPHCARSCNVVDKVLRGRCRLLARTGVGQLPVTPQDAAVKGRSPAVGAAAELHPRRARPRHAAQHPATDSTRTRDRRCSAVGERAAAQPPRGCAAVRAEGGAGSGGARPGRHRPGSAVAGDSGREGTVTATARVGRQGCCAVTPTAAAPVIVVVWRPAGITATGSPARGGRGRTEWL